MNQVICSKLNKSYQGNSAIKNCSLQIQAGEILALLGPSGCGKTTMLRMIAGFEHADTGEIQIGDRLVASPSTFVAPEHRQVGMVFQHYALFPHLTVAQNVAYGIRGKQAAQQVKAMLKLVDLDGLQDRMPHQLSGGQQQRVALARALAPQPAVLLLDEPFSNLDADLRASMRIQVRQILKQVGTTALFVTHDQEEALYMGDRVAIMHAGKLEQADLPQQLYLAPASRFVAEFLGQASFLPAQVTPKGLATDLGFVEQQIAAAPGTQIQLVARPDDLQVQANPHGNAQVIGRVFRGGEYLYDLQLDNSQSLQCICNHIHDFAIGSRVQVQLNPGHDLAWFPLNN